MFINRFANSAYPLTCLLHKGAAIEWTSECDASFRQLKFLLTSPPILRHFDPSAPTEVHTDASGVGIGAVFVQRNDREHVIAYASRTLSKTERNYTVTEQERLAVIFAVLRFRSYLYGRPFTVATDHRSLCLLVNLRDPCGRLERWTLRQQEYDFAVVYKSGRRHADANCPSRMPLATTESTSDNFDNYISALASEFPDVTYFKTQQRKDPDLLSLFADAQNYGPSSRFRHAV